MVKANDFGITLMAELAVSLTKNGWNPKDVHNLYKDKDLLKKLYRVLHGVDEITPKEFIFDLSAQPLLPQDDGEYPFEELTSDDPIIQCSIIEHKKMGECTWDPSNFRLIINQTQDSSHNLSGFDIKESLADRNVCNATLLDCLLKYSLLIPENWKNNQNIMCFWGTIYQNEKGEFVRFLRWNEGRNRWASGCLYLKDTTKRNRPSLILEQD